MRLTLFFILVLFGTAANAASFSINPKVGAEVSLASMQALLAAPPLPRIDGGKTNEVPVAVNFLSATYSESDPLNVGTVNKGEFDGYAYSVGWVSKEKNGYRIFAWLMGNSASGDLKAVSATETFKISDLEASSQALTIGLGKRLLGQAKSFFSFGVFTGLSYFKFESTFKVPVDTGPDLSIEFNPQMYGAIVGVQINFLFGSYFLVNPYALYFGDLSGSCRELEGSGGHCVEIPGSFMGVGVNVGVAGLAFSVVSKVLKSESSSGVEAHNYGVSYTFGFQ